MSLVRGKKWSCIINTIIMDGETYVSLFLYDKIPPHYLMNEYILYFNFPYKVSWPRMQYSEFWGVCS